MQENQEQSQFKLDAAIETPEERTALVQKIIDNTPPNKLTTKYIGYLTEYIIDAVNAQEKKKKNKQILTENRLETINTRETSYEGLVSELENGEDGIYNMITWDKNIILTPKVSITPKDVAAIPALKSLRDSIAAVEEEFKNATGTKKSKLLKQLKEMRKDQYVIKNSYYQPKYSTKKIKSIARLDLTENITIETKIEGGKEKQEIKSDGLINLFNPDHISLLLCNYSKLKEEVDGKFSLDTFYLMIDLENLTARALKDYPLYYDLLIYKIDGMQNADIQVEINSKYGVKYSLEYLSSLWRNKIPKLIAECAKEEYLIWYYTEKERGQWKRCSRCNEIKLANPKFFSKNKSSRDGYYSICKCCRSKKSGQNKIN